MRKYNKEELKKSFVQKAKNIHNNRYDYSKVRYINSKTKIAITCPSHGIFYQTPADHIQGHGCPICAREYRTNKMLEYSLGRKKKCQANFVKKAQSIHGNRYDYSKTKYVDYNTKVTIICPIHGEFIQGVNNHLRGCGCPKCAAEGMSKGERTLIDILDAHNIPYVYQKIINIPNWPQKMIVDFQIVLNNKTYFIEYNGVQHYQPIEYFGGEKYFFIQQERDRVLKEYCETNEIKLLEIKYDLPKLEIEELIIKIFEDEFRI